MEDITDADWKHSKRVCKSFKRNSLGEHYDLYAHGDTLLLTDVFNNFWNMCLEMYALEPADFLWCYKSYLCMILSGWKNLNSKIDRMARSKNKMENNNQIDLKFWWKTNISSLHSNAHLRSIY